MFYLTTHREVLYTAIWRQTDVDDLFFSRSIGCVKSFVPLGSQNGLSGVAPKFGIHCGTNRSDVLPLSLLWSGHNCRK